LIRVIKVGGSLLDLPDLPDRLNCWIGLQKLAARNIIVAGGGDLVEVIRRWNAQSPIGEVAAHWMCVDAMSITARLLAERLSQFAVTDSFVTVESTTETVIFDCARWVRDSNLPARWSLTSDSIAAALAAATGAFELVLMKSTAPPNPQMTIEEFSRIGLVDTEFANWGRGIPNIVVVNLRDLD
jgi:aspartokinase-like uncharacterized kinase